MSPPINQYARRLVDNMPNPAETATQALGTLGKVVATEGNILALKNNYVNNNYRVRVNFPSGVDTVRCTVTSEGELRYNSQTFEQFKLQILSGDDAEHYKRRMQERARIERSYKIAKHLVSWQVLTVVFLVMFVTVIPSALFITAWCWLGLGLIGILSFTVGWSKPLAIRITGLKRRRRKWNDTIHDISPSLAYKVSELAMEVKDFQTIDVLRWQKIAPVDFSLDELNGGSGIFILGSYEKSSPRRVLYGTSGFKEL